MAQNIEHERKKKKMKKYYIIGGIITYIYIVFVYFHYCYLKQENVRLGFAEGINQSLSHVFLHPLLFKASPMSALMALCAGFGVFLFILIAASEHELKKTPNQDTINGEAHLMTEEELKAYNMKMTDPFGKTDSNGPNNMIFSKDVKLAMDGFKTRRNCNVLVIGGSGAGKSRFFASPNILQYNSNFVITDPSGELLNDYGKALEDNGYEVKVFNISDVYRGNRYNPFHYIKEEKDVFVLVNTLIKNTTPPDGKGGDPFWENSEKVLLSALILYLWHWYPEKQQTFANVVELINMAEVDENDATAKSPLDLLFEDLEREDPDNLAVQQYKTFKLGAGKTLKSILISVGVRLESFKLSDIQYLTEKDEFEFEKFADTRQALFVIIPTADTTFNFLVSLMYSQLFSSLYSYVESTCNKGWQAYVDNLHIIKVEQAHNDEESKDAEKKIDALIKDIQSGLSIKYDKVKDLYRIYTKKGKVQVGWRGTKEMAKSYAEQLKHAKKRQCPRKCPNHVRLILDEFANIGQIPDFDQKLATIRKYEISCSIILQAISQLKEMYDKKWNTIAANCDTKLFLGCDDSETIEWLLKMLGKKTTKTASESYQGNGGGSRTINHSSLELLTIDQITMMQDDECLVRVRGKRPQYGKKYELTDHPNYKYAKSKEGKFVIPLSDAIQQKIDMSKGPLRNRNKTGGATNMPNGNSVQENPQISDKNVQKKGIERKNTTAKKESEIAKEALNGIDKENIENAESAVITGLSETLGVNSSTSLDAIKEIAESIMSFDIPPMEEVSYLATN